MRKTNNEGSTLPQHSFEFDAAIVLVHDYGPRNGEPLPSAFSYFLGSEEGVEYLGPRLHRNPPSGISNPDLDPGQLREIAYLRRVCDAKRIAYKSGDGAGKLQIELFEKTGEHTLVQPTFAYAYPAEVSPLSRRNDRDPFITDRWEFFIGGRELANGFSELNDSEDQAQRFKDQVERKAGGDEEAMYYDADYVRALEYGMPPTAGLGLGVDRVVMLFANAPSIRDVLLFPHMRPEL